ncbi:carbohydrate ABC transporter permease [Caldisalinibacter kiritimatiensis]|uniref:Putative permease n=1 Tax=Caldisalinibacter kiritimatiensis TaxID=1304284 RepID=R1CX45_9FIRM|nr:carbohydrate ABC transporter permease [Caldisalinibacter kiritimatiensis]EOD01199.1 Putative permease [Caldisalinibacter kiritimatiensis]
MERTYECKYVDNKKIKKGIRIKRHKVIKNFIIYAILISGAFVVIYPFFFMVINSLKTGPEIMHHPNALPREISLKGYIGVFKLLDVPRLFLNTIFISGSVTILNTIFSSMVAYGIVKTQIPGRKVLFKIILGSMMIPGILLLIPTYMMMYNWNWINTYRVLIIPAAISAYNIFLMMQFMKQIDNAYLEAARIDGASEWQIFWKIVLPMSKPALATIMILTFMGSWNDFFGPLLYLRDESLMTLQLGLYRFSSSIPGKHIEQLWAATTMISIPVVIVFFFLQKNFIKAFTGIGLK